MQRTNTAVWLEKYGRWQIKVQKDGVRRTFTSSVPGRTGQREANAKADQWLDGGIVKDTARMSELWESFIAAKEATTSFANVKKLKEAWKNDIEPAIGNRPIRKVTEDDLQRILDSAYAKRHLSKKSLMNISACISALFKFCRKRLKATTLEPELEIPAAATSKEKTILQPDDLATLFSVSTTILRGKRVEDPYIHAYRFQVLTGLRPGELIGLEYGDVKKKTVRIRRSINFDQMETRGKNENAIREFSLSDRARSELDAQIADLPRPLDLNTRIFQIRSERHYYDCWVRFCESNGLSKVTPYELRHTFVSVAKYLPAGEVKSIVGHSKSMDTFGVYGHVLDGDHETVASDVNALFDKLLKKA